MKKKDSQVLVVRNDGTYEGFDEAKRHAINTIMMNIPASIEELKALIGYIPPSKQAIYNDVWEDEEVLATLRQQRMMIVSEVRREQVKAKHNPRVQDSLLRQYTEQDVLARIAGLPDAKNMDLTRRATIIIQPPQQHKQIDDGAAEAKITFKRDDGQAEKTD